MLQASNAGEYISRNYQTFLDEQGITHQRTVLYIPEQNGIAEWNNRSLLATVKYVLMDTRLPNQFWDEAVVKQSIWEQTAY